MIKRLIIFLIRVRLGLKKREFFQFDNQKTDSIYFFTENQLRKIEEGIEKRSSVSLNWLLDDRCKITILGDK